MSLRGSVGHCNAIAVSTAWLRLSGTWLQTKAERAGQGCYGWQWAPRRTLRLQWQPQGHARGRFSRQRTGRAAARRAVAAPGLNWPAASDLPAREQPSCLAGHCLGRQPALFLGLRLPLLEQLCRLERMAAK